MKKALVLLLALISACNHIQESGLIPDDLSIEDFLPVETPTDESVIREYFEISRVDETYVESTGATYYTVYGVNMETGEEWCLADDVSPEWAENEPWLIVVGMHVELVYEAGQPSYTGELFPAYSEGFN